MPDVSAILAAASAGDARAAADLLPLVYAELRTLAAARLAVERPDHTLSPTALVHEAFLRLTGPTADDRWANRGHFFAAAAEAIRRILVESARRKRSAKRGGGLRRTDLDDVPLTAPPPDELLAVSDALDGLAAEYPRHAELVKLRYFVGLTLAEAAEAVGVSVATAKRDWEFSRAWLFRAVGGENLSAG